MINAFLFIDIFLLHHIITKITNENLLYGIVKLKPEVLFVIYDKDYYYTRFYLTIISVSISIF